MTRIYLIFLLIFITFVSNAQLNSLNSRFIQKRTHRNMQLKEVSYGVIPMTLIKSVSEEDFDVESPRASAIYLLNIGATKVSYDLNVGYWKASTEKLIRIKILSTDGLDLGNVRVPLVNRGNLAKKQERISEIRAITYHLNEKTGELDSSVMSNENVVQTNVREYLDEVTFALPNVQVNSIIEIAYTVESPFISRLDDWYFQKNYPVKKSWYTVSVYGPYRYAFALQGQKQLKNAKTNDENGLTALGRLRERHRRGVTRPLSDLPYFKPCCKVDMKQKQSC